MKVLWWLSVGTQAIVLWRLGTAHVLWRYPFFSGFLTVSVLRSCYLFTQDLDTKAYLYGWLATEPLLLVLMLLSAVEALRRTLEAYPGKRDAFSILLVLFSGIAVTFMFLTSTVDSTLPEERWQVLHAMGVVRRSLTGSLAVFLLVATCWLTWLPVPERANVRLHRVLMTFYLLSAAVSQLAINLGFPPDKASFSALAASVVCYCGWFRMSAKGEELRARGPLTEAEIERMEADARRYRQLLR
jgi:hypothetical protein